MLILFLITWGMLAGWAAQAIMGRARGMRSNNWAEALVAGIIGSFVGGLLISLISGDGFALKPSGIIGSIVGALLVLAVWTLIRGGKTSARS